MFTSNIFLYFNQHLLFPQVVYYFLFLKNFIKLQRDKV